MFEMWLPIGMEMKSVVGDNVVCTTRGASQVLLSVMTQKVCVVSCACVVCVHMCIYSGACARLTS